MAIRLFIFCTFSMLLFSGCGKVMYRSAAKAYQTGLESQPYDAIIVPGFPYSGMNWDMVLKMRIHWATYLYKKGYAKNIIFSGSAVATPYIESRIMALYAEALGVPAKNIYTEEKAEHSTENIYNSYRLAKKLGFGKVALASDPYQSSYMGKFMRKFELPVALLPTVIDTLKVLDLYEPKIDPAKAQQENFLKLSAREGLFKRIRGTMGGYIQWHEDDLKKEKYKKRFKKRIIRASETDKGSN